MYLAEITAYRYSLANKLLGLEAKSESIIISKNGEVSCYSLKKDNNVQKKASKLFLRKDFLKLFFNDSKKTRDKYWLAAEKIRELELNKIDSDDLLNIANEFFDIIKEIFKFFELSRPEYQVIPEEKIKNLVKTYLKDETVINELLSVTEQDEIMKAQSDWVHFCVKKRSKKELLDYALSNVWLFPSANNKKDLLAFIEKRYKETNKLGRSYLRNKLFNEIQILKERKIKQQELFKADKSGQLKDFSLLFQNLALERGKLKNCWEDTRYHVNEILDEISKRTKISLNNILWYRLEEIFNLLKGSKQLSKKVINSRKKVYAFVYKDYKINFFELDKAKAIFIKTNQDQESKEKLLRGSTVFHGKTNGKVVIVSISDLETLNKSIEEFKNGDILVTPMTQPNMVILAERAAAIITDEGGISSHAAILAREFQIPCIVGVGMATKILKTGDLVEVDANRGLIKILTKDEFLSLSKNVKSLSFSKKEKIKNLKIDNSLFCKENSLSFKRINSGDSSIAGGKGASLGEMTNAGIPVPKGFVVLASTFDKVVEKSGLLKKLNSLLRQIDYSKIDTLENVSKNIRKEIEDIKIPEKIEGEIKQAFQRLNVQYVAVRSSATAEDSAEASWAGELESYLYTRENNLFKNIKKCWSSLFTPRALIYKRKKGLLNSWVSVAVVVQEMVESEVSGICFTVHPITKNDKNMIVEAGYGIGEAIVGGKIIPDTYTINKKNITIVSKKISNQSMMIVKGPNGTKESHVPENKQSKQKLTDKQILQLSQICLNIEKHYQKPQDIEWIYKRGKFYIVQSRPITTL